MRKQKLLFSARPVQTYVPVPVVPQFMFKKIIALRMCLSFISILVSVILMTLTNLLSCLNSSIIKPLPQICSACLLIWLLAYFHRILFGSLVWFREQQLYMCAKVTTNETIIWFLIYIHTYTNIEIFPGNKQNKISQVWNCLRLWVSLASLLVVLANTKIIQPKSNLYTYITID